MLDRVQESRVLPPYMARFHTTITAFTLGDANGVLRVSARQINRQKGDEDLKFWNVGARAIHHQRVLLLLLAGINKMPSQKAWQNIYKTTSHRFSPVRCPLLIHNHAQSA